MFNIISDIFFTTHFDFLYLTESPTFWECKCLYVPTTLQVLFSTYSNHRYLFNNERTWRREKSGKVYFSQINLRDIGLYA
jgi:hypothetical protein